MARPAYGSSPATFAPFVVYCDYKPKGRRAYEPYTSRLGGYASLKEAKRAIAANDKELRSPNTYGGLIDWGEDDTERKYRIFECVYTQVK